MVDDGVSYETKIVRAVRGLEGRTISKWQEQGWELVSQSQGRLQTEIVIRRPKPKVPLGLILAGGAVALFLFVALGLGLLLGEDDGAASSEPTSAAGASAVSTPGETGSNAATSSVATQAKPTKTEPAVLTVKNSPELASMLKLGNYCDESIQKFSEKHRGQTIAFEANIGAMNNHGSYKTRYDILLTAGPYSETTSPGPAFQFRDENTTSDLHYKGDAGDTIGVGTNLYIKAEVKEYEPSTCLFLLEPVETTVHMPR